MTTVGQRVAELRRAAGMTQADLADAVDRSVSWVSQVERGVLPLDRVSILQSLAGALRVPVGKIRPEFAFVDRKKKAT